MQQHTIDKILDSGIQEHYALPLNSEQDIVFKYTYLRLRSPQNNSERQEFLAKVSIEYKGQLLLDNIVDLALMKTTLRHFESNKVGEEADNKFFKEKVKNNTRALQLTIDTKRYISAMEAGQMHALITIAMAQVSKKILLRDFLTESSYFYSTKHNKEVNPHSREMENTEVVDY